ncbi:DUF5916 domain-containing protein [Neolewinella antarctica]|uniref:Hydrolase n=1 Tax=Neolewinella antarctica TaxID=442734 RepID=A0ABX0XDX1_9BACT|nr:DUF5916 domain-containing protein [Neolewinella antarctica]NJC27109.1 hypothetical protein [Neolewinella antarctica]
MRSFLCPCLALCLVSLPAFGQDEKPVYETQRLVGDAPTIDGNISDTIWNQVPWADLNYQVQPSDAEPVSQETRFKILYDQKNLYVAFRAFDTNPEKIEARLGRRDDFPGDYVEINFDSFNDKRTGFSFSSSVSGVRGDEFISNDGENWDSNWDPFWFMKAKQDSIGYTVEARIPFSQLRFGKAPSQEWGLQVTRLNFREQERDAWSPVKQDQNGWVSRFGTLKGIENIKARKPLELQPYVLGQVRTGGKFNADDPFSRKTDTRASVGLDGRIGLTNDIAVDFTINPDFGQVEADPGAINLDGFQIFFREQRPFFVENANIFDYQLTQSEAGGNYTGDLLFYSRRIGGVPSRFIQGDPVNGRYVQQPENTTILGAAKVSGKTQSGLSLGLLSSVTERELADIVNVNNEETEVVEPLTSYNVGRVQQDFNDRNSSIGVILTTVNRDLEGNEDLEFLHNSAYSGGVDLVHRWKDRAWQMRVNLLASQVRGSEQAITRTQRSFEHLFQRPDASHLGVDSTRTSLEGTGGTVTVGNFAGDWIFEAGATYRSPGLEINDIGFLSNTDQVNAFAWGSRVWRKPQGIFNRRQWNHNIFLGWDFDGSSLERRYNTNVNATFKNFSFFNAFLNLEQQDISKNALRGGPLLRRSPGFYTGFYYRTDNRKKMTFGVFANGGGSYDGNTEGRGAGFEVRYQPLDALALSFEPEFEWGGRNDQYIDTQTDGDRTAYLHGRIDRQTLTLTLRAIYNLTPDFTIQYYAQPFITKGEYTQFNRLGDPDARDFGERFPRYADEELSFDKESSVYSVNDDADAATDFTFDDPDFNFIQFRSNLVFRWEYRPSSTLFFVWQQGGSGGGDPTKNSFETVGDLFDQEIRNTFLVKAAYRWVR